MGGLLPMNAGSAAGLSMMYRALRLGKVGVVAPIASTEGAIAAVISIALGEQLTTGVEEGQTGRGPPFGLAAAAGRPRGILVDIHSADQYKCG